MINEILIGDCIEITNILLDKSIDCLITDPPYSSGARRDAEKSVRGSMLRSDKHEWFSHDNMSTLGFTWFIRHLLIALKPKLKENAPCFMFIDWRQYPTLAQIIESTGYRLNDLIVWDKKQYGLGSFFRNQYELITFFSNGAPKKPTRKDIGNIIKIKNIPSQDKLHPTEKPLELLRVLIKISTVEEEIIYDPMCGSGTTCIAAQQLNRKYIGVDINPLYVNIAKKRIHENPLSIINVLNPGGKEDG